MTTKQKNYKKGLIRSIHTSKLWREVYSTNRGFYESMLEHSFGVKSSKDLSIEELKRLDDFMNKRDREDGICVPRVIVASKQQISFVQTLWIRNSREKSIDSLLKFATRILKREVEDITSISKKEASALIGAVKKVESKGAKDENTGDR